MLGKKHTETAKLKMSIFQKGKRKPKRFGESNSNYKHGKYCRNRIEENINDKSLGL
jgi:hypothetical protein